MFTLDQQNRDPEEIGELAYNATPQTMQQAKRLMAYRRNRTKLAWALICIVDAVQQSSVLHNDITPANVMLHFPNEDGRTVWIGLCDWGMASRINEETHSLYQFKDSSEVRNARARRWWVAPELMHVIGEPGTSTSPTRVVRPPRVSIHTDGYAVGKLAEKIWKKDRLNTEMLPDNMTAHFFGLTLQELYRSDPLQRRSVTHVVSKLSGAPLFWTPPVICYREARKEQALLQQQARNED
jgi:serine/threonine protein kinase